MAGILGFEAPAMEVDGGKKKAEAAEDVKLEEDDDFEEFETQGNAAHPHRRASHARDRG